MMIIERTGEIIIGTVVDYVKCPQCGRQALVYPRYERIRVWEKRNGRLELVEVSALRLEKNLLYCPWCGYQTLIY